MRFEPGPSATRRLTARRPGAARGSQRDEKGETTVNESDRKEPEGATRPWTPSEREWNEIRESLRGLRFGSVHISVQDGVIVQIDRTEKRRLRGG